MSNNRDFYEILGISKNASPEEIKKAYRKMAIKYHPDKNPGDKVAEESFKEAAEAYEVLSNPQKKQRYDQFGHAGLGGSSGGGHHHMNVDEIFENFGDIFGNFFGGGRSRSQGRRMRKGTNLRLKLSLTLSDIAQGVTKKLKVKRMMNAEGVTFKSCNNCNGIGQVQKVTNTMLGQMMTNSTCHVCQGSGQIIDTKPPHVNSSGLIAVDDIIEAKIPPGVEEGMQLSLQAKGNMPPGGGVAGDLIILIEEKKHDELTREGNNIIYEAHVSFIDATLGQSIEIPTISGKAKINLKAGTQSGKILRLKGKGIPDLNNPHYLGDQLVHINVWTPTHLTAHEKKLLESLRDSDHFKPNPNSRSGNLFDKLRGILS